MTDHKAEPMRGSIIEVDFGKDTVTFRMEPPYYVSSGEFLIAPIGGGISLDSLTAAPAASEGEDGAVATFTTGHCENKKKPGGCPLHNLHCGWPKCDRREVASQKEATPEDAPAVDTNHSTNGDANELAQEAAVCDEEPRGDHEPARTHGNVQEVRRDGGLAPASMEVAPPAEAHEPVGDAVAWLHTIQQGGGEHDQALSFAPDNFPLGDELGFRSLGAVPLFTQPPSDAEPFGWYLAEDWLGWRKGYTFRTRPTGGATTTAPFIPLYAAPTEAATVGLEMAAWSERLSGPHDNRTVRRLLLEWAKRLTTTPKHDEGWKEAVIEECIAACIDWIPDDPQETLRRLIAWREEIALDPAVSDRAAALATQPAARRVTDGPLAQPLKAEWTPDCSGKQDFDADLIALSTRYWPRGGGYLVVNGGVVYDNDSRPEVLPSAKASILAQGDKIASAYFEADSEAEVKAQVEQWATRQWDRIRSALAESFAQPAEGVPRKKHDGPCWRNSHADCGC